MFDSIAGFVFRNVPGVGFGGDISKQLSKNFRGVALAFILSRAGLGLDIQVCFIHARAYA